MDEITDFVGTTYKKYTSDFTTGLEHLELVDPIKPDAHDPPIKLHLNFGRSRSKCIIKRHKKGMIPGIFHMLHIICLSPGKSF